MVKTNKELNNTKIRRFQLCVDKLETLEDVKKVLNAMKIRIDTDNLDWSEAKRS